MKILIAGASGAIGQPLITLLVNEGHDVYGICRSKEKAQNIIKKGAKPIILDVLNKQEVNKVVKKVSPDVVVDMLTSLPKEYTPQAMKDASEMDTKIRLVGGSYLQTAAEEHQVKRYIAQSCCFWYEPGLGAATESTSFALKASPGIVAGVNNYLAIEERVLKSKKLDGVALRFGFYYGPGTWFNKDGNMADQFRKQEFPQIGTGQGVWNFVHIEDAAHAIVASLSAQPGVYNIVNDQPIKMCDWLPAFAKYVGAPKPPILSEKEGLEKRGADSVYYSKELRAASNEKAKRSLAFKPRPLEWID